MKLTAFYENIAEAAKQSEMTIDEMIIHLRDLGLERICILGDNMLSEREWVLRTLPKLGVSLEGTHEHFDFGNHPEDESWKPMMDAAIEAGAATFLVVPGLIEPEEESRRDEMIANMIAVTRKIVDYAAGRIDVVMEDFDDLRSPYNTMAGFDYFLEQIPGLKPVYDTGNLVCYHEDELEGFEHYADRICFMHIKDRSRYHDERNDYPCVCEQGIEEWVVPVGTGYIRIAEIIDRLKQRGYDGGLLIELYGYKDMLNGFEISIENMKKMLA